jgi:glycosyltransferase involved in cell wall biosynthesis
MRVLWVIYGSLDQLSGGYLYDRRVVEHLRAHGVEVQLLGLSALPYILCPLHGLDPRLRAAFSPRRREEGREGGWDAVVIDELIHPSVAFLAARRARARRRGRADSWPPLLTLVHHLRCREDRSRLDRVIARRFERLLLGHSDALVVNSRTTARTVEELLEGTGTASRPAICPPGCDQMEAGHEVRSWQPHQPPGPVRLFACGNLIPRKGYDLLLEMLAGLAELPWELRIAGRAVDRAHHAMLVTLAGRLGLAGRVHLLGELDTPALAEEYRRADVFVHAARYEGYGISLAEAVRAGLPFVAFASGAIPEVVGGRGMLAAPGDRTAFAAHLRCLIDDPASREKAAALSHELAAALPTWEDTGRLFLDALREAAGWGGSGHA